MVQAGDDTDDVAAARTLDRPRTASAIVSHETWSVALEHATDQVMSPGDPPPDVLLLFASPAYGPSFPQLIRAARERTGTTTLVGCSASGFLAGDAEVEDKPGLALMALWLPGAHIHPIRLHQEHVELLDDPTVWFDMHRFPPAEVNSWLVFVEPFRIDARALVQGLQSTYPDASIMGGMASGMVEERMSCVFFDDQVYQEGGVALGIGGPYSLIPHVSQGCDPVGEPWTITAVEHNTLIGISNRPALEVLQDTVNGLTSEQRERAQNNVVVGLAVDEYRDRFDRGDFLVRGILGIDPKRGAIAVGGVPRVGQTIQFHLRDATSSHADLVRMMGEVAASGEPETAVGVVVCTCDGRGERLFGVPNHDTGVVRAALGRVPLIGAFCIGEIGPLGNQTVLHGFTATIGVLRHHPAAP
jgi:small ligand-binding sensory domain FIST